MPLDFVNFDECKIIRQYLPRTHAQEGNIIGCLIVVIIIVSTKITNLEM